MTSPTTALQTDRMYAATFQWHGDETDETIAQSIMRVAKQYGVVLADLQPGGFGNYGRLDVTFRSPDITALVDIFCSPDGGDCKPGDIETGWIYPVMVEDQEHCASPTGDHLHSESWYDCQPCDFCNDDSVPESCDCDRHSHSALTK